MTPPGRDTRTGGLVARFRGRGGRHGTTAVVAAVAALSVSVGLGVTRPGGVESPASTASSSTRPTTSPAAGAGWRLLRQSGGARDVEQYADLDSLFAAAPLLVRGTVARVDVGPVQVAPGVERPYRDLVLTLAPTRTAGPASVGGGVVVVQLGPFFGGEAAARARQLSHGPESLIGDDTVWALRPRADAPTYRPLTSASTFVRDGDDVLVPMAADTSVGADPAAASWSRLVAAAGLG